MEPNKYLLLENLMLDLEFLQITKNFEFNNPNTKLYTKPSKIIVEPPLSKVAPSGIILKLGIDEVIRPQVIPFYTNNPCLMSVHHLSARS